MEIQVKKDGKILKAEAQIIKGHLWVYYEGRIFKTDVSGTRSSRSKTHHATSSNEVHAPMPGKVTKILVSEGSQIAKGQAVIVMEAMKMEYTLKADISGIVEKINCQQNEQVTLGHLLVQLKEEK